MFYVLICVPDYSDLEKNDLSGEIPGSLMAIKGIFGKNGNDGEFCMINDNPKLCKSDGDSTQVLETCQRSVVDYPKCEASQIPFQTPMEAGRCDTGYKRQDGSAVTGSCIPKKRCNEEGRPSRPGKCMEKHQINDICCFNL